MNTLLLTASLRPLFLLSLGVFLGGSLLHVEAGPSQRSPSEVLLVYNSNSPISTAIADYYKQKRNITNVVAVSCQDSALGSNNETITLVERCEIKTAGWRAGAPRKPRPIPPSAAAPSGEPGFHPSLTRHGRTSSG